MIKQPKGNHKAIQAIESAGFTACVSGEKRAGAISAPAEAFQSDPQLILKGIALAAELDFIIEPDTFEAMKAASAGLDKLSADEIREGFEEILTAASPARGLRYSAAAGIMPFVLGEECYPPKSRHEIDSFTTLMEQYDEVRPEAEYRWPLLFLCFDEKRAESAIRRLKFDERSEFLYLSSLKKIQELYFIVKPQDFKKFLYRNGWDNYEFWENVTKQQRKVYDHQENRIKSRYYMLQEFEQYKMAIFLEDLAVDAGDLLAAGIPEHKVDILLEKLLYMVHYKPRLNTKDYLIAEAKRYNRNPFSKYFRDVHFLK